MYSHDISTIAFGLLALSFAPLAHGAESIVDNELVTVWEIAVALPPSPHDFAEVSLSRKGVARFGIWPWLEMPMFAPAARLVRDCPTC